MFTHGTWMPCAPASRKRRIVDGSLVVTRAIGVTPCNSEARQRPFDVTGFERTVLTIEDDEVPALHGDVLGQRRLGVSEEQDRMTASPFFSFFLVVLVVSMCFLSRYCKLTTSSQLPDSKDRIMAAITEATLSASLKLG